MRTMREMASSGRGKSHHVQHGIGVEGETSLTFTAFHGMEESRSTLVSVTPGSAEPEFSVAVRRAARPQ